jgi:hypothetical protein
MNGLIVYYTNCLLPKPMLKRTIEDAISASRKSGFGLVISSHLPISQKMIGCEVDFDGLVQDDVDERLSCFFGGFDVRVDLPDDAINVVTGILTYSPETILSQIVHAMEISQVSMKMPVVLWEHDVLYPDGYIEKVCAPISAGRDYSLYYDHVFADQDGFFKPNMHFWHLSRYAAKISALHEHFSAKIRFGSMGILEPVPAEFANGDERPGDVVDNYAVVYGSPVVDFKHGANASGQMIIEGRSDNNASWGDFSPYSRLFDDEDYESFLASKPDVGYGLFTCKSSDAW